MATTTTATATGPIAASVPRGHSTHSSLGTLAPLNTPTRRFYGSHEQSGIPDEPGVPNPNVYVVQPFKNASVPKDFVYAKKVKIEIIRNFKIKRNVQNAPNPGEHLLNSTIALINHFTSCYEAVKQQLQEEHTKERESVLVSRSTTIGGTANTVSRSASHKRTKQAR